MSDIERLAQVAHDAACINVNSSDFFLSDEGARNIVRAILRAMREPSEDSAWAGSMSVDIDGFHTGIAAHIWQAMVQSILAETET